MTTQRAWHDERSMDDAPVWYGADEANAWASGWNAAVEALRLAATIALAVHLGWSWWLLVLIAAVVVVEVS